MRTTLRPTTRGWAGTFSQAARCPPRARSFTLQTISRCRSTGASTVATTGRRASTGFRTWTRTPRKSAPSLPSSTATTTPPLPSGSTIGGSFSSRAQSCSATTTARSGS
eukprot:Amastigsp_a178909_182.p4 type:complete len:109 gc:universal Amastigsp_a178909_182:368-42(-)